MRHACCVTVASTRCLLSPAAIIPSIPGASWRRWSFAAFVSPLFPPTFACCPCYRQGTCCVRRMCSCGLAQSLITTQSLPASPVTDEARASWCRCSIAAFFSPVLPPILCLLPLVADKAHAACGGCAVLGLSVPPIFACWPLLQMRRVLREANAQLLPSSSVSCYPPIFACCPCHR